MNDTTNKWETKKLGDICKKLQYGWTSSAKTHGNLKYIRTTDISSGKVDWDTVPYCEVIPKDKSKYIINKGDIVISRAGSIGISYMFEDTPFEAVFASYLIRLQLKENVNPKFIYYFLKSEIYWDAIKESSSGIALPNVNASKLAEIQLAIPPLEEQNYIVEKLDKIFSKIDLNLIKIKKIVDYESRLLYSFLNNKDGLYQELNLNEFIEESNIRIGKNWEGKRKIGVSSENGITELRVGTKSTFDNYKIVKKGYFIYNPMRINIGSIALYDSEDVAITSPDYVVFKTTSELSPLLLLYYLKSDLGLQEIVNNTQGAVRERLYFESLQKVKIPFNSDMQENAEKIFSIFSKLKLIKSHIYRSFYLLEQQYLSIYFQLN